MSNAYSDSRRIFQEQISSDTREINHIKQVIMSQCPNFEENIIDNYVKLLFTCGTKQMVIESVILYLKSNKNIKEYSMNEIGGTHINSVVVGSIIK